MTRHRSSILVLGALCPNALQALDHQFGVVAIADAHADILRQIPDTITCLIYRSPFKVSEELLQGLSSLKWVIRAGAGRESIDLQRLEQRGISFTQVPGGGGSVAELAFGLLLARLRDIEALHASLRQGRWEKYRAVGSEISGKTAVIVGFGRIGQQIGRIAVGFGARVLAVDSTPEKPEKCRAARALNAQFRSLYEALSEADFLFLTCPLTAQTRFLINESVLAVTKPGCTLVNVARGAVVDRQALLKALDDGRLAGACLDVFETEPPGADPLVAHPAVVATPHVGAQTAETMSDIGRRVVELVQGYASASA
jgi:phosphoglycerate dehydrogenase-like enzyme